MRKLLAGSTACLLLVSAVIAGTTVAGSVPTAGAPDCPTPRLISARLSPATAVLGPDQQRVARQTVRVASTCVNRLRADLLSPTFGETVEMHRLPGQGGQSLWSARIRISSRGLTNADAGRWRSRLRSQGSQSFSGTGDGIRVLRATRMAARIVDAGAGSGGTLMLQGHLTRASWSSGRYQAYPSRTVILQKRRPSGEFRSVEVVTTGRDGSVEAPISGDGGCFRFVVRGNQTTAGTRSKTDCVPLP